MEVLEMTEKEIAINDAALEAISIGWEQSLQQGFLIKNDLLN